FSPAGEGGLPERSPQRGERNADVLHQWRTARRRPELRGAPRLPPASDRQRIVELRPPPLSAVNLWERLRRHNQIWTDGMAELPDDVLDLQQRAFRYFLDHTNARNG